MPLPPVGVFTKAVTRVLEWAKAAETASGVPNTGKFFYDASKAMNSGKPAVLSAEETQRLIRAVQQGLDTVAWRASDPLRDEAHLKALTGDLRRIGPESQALHVDLSPDARASLLRGRNSNSMTPDNWDEAHAMFAESNYPASGYGVRPVAVRLGNVAKATDDAANSVQDAARFRAQGKNSVVYTPVEGELAPPGETQYSQGVEQFIRSLASGQWQPSAGILDPTGVRSLYAPFLQPKKVGLNFAGGGHVGMEHTKSSGQDASTQPVDSQWRAALRSYLAGGGSVQPQRSLADYFKANVPVPMHEGEGAQLRNRFPQTYGGLAGLLGTPPDEMAGSVLEPGYEDRKAGAEKTFSLGTLLQMLPMAPTTKGMPVGAIIRNTGDNNFLKGSVENALAGLKGKIPQLKELNAGRPKGAPAMTTDEYVTYLSGLRDVPLNKFVEGPLTRYVKQQMATPEDPIRALAEQGVLHFDPPYDLPGWAHGVNGRASTPLGWQRLAENFPAEGVGKSELAQRWEGLADSSLDTTTASDLMTVNKGPYRHGSSTVDENIRNNPWLATKPPETKVFTATPEMRDLGFTHLTDELRNALNPESGLPRNLLLTPEKLQNFGMEKAVRHVAAINDWRAAQVAEANAQKANNAATVLYKEYPHTDTTPNPKNLRWQELVIPKGPEGYVQEGTAWRHPDDTTKPWFYPEDAFKEAVKYEGDTMGHSVGGYASEGGYGLGGLDAIRTGKARVYSLRDAKGEPHVTIEVGTKVQDPMFEAPRAVQDQISRQAHQEARARGLDPESDDYMDVVLGRQQELSDLWNATQPVEPRITQVKGKGNKKPNDEYQPFVQDFVKSGKWSDVGDLQNTGLRRTSDAWNANELKKIQEAGIEMPSHATQAEIDAIGEQVWPGQWGASTKGFATGGRVSMVHPAAAIQPLVRVPGFDRF